MMKISKIVIVQNTMHTVMVYVLLLVIVSMIPMLDTLLKRCFILYYQNDRLCRCKFFVKKKTQTALQMMYDKLFLTNFERVNRESPKNKRQARAFG